MPQSTPRVQLQGFSTLYRAVWLCRVPAGAKLCLESSTFEVYFMASDKDLTHATMLNSSAQYVLNFLQNIWQWCYCTRTWNFSSIWWLLLYRGTAHSTLHSLKCGIMPCLAVQNAELCRGQCTVSTSLLILLHSLFFHINKIHLVNVPTEWCITNTIGMIKASWRHRLTNQLSLYVQRPAVSGPRNFRTSRSISISRSSTNLRTRQLWDIKQLHCTVQSKQKNGRECRKPSTIDIGDYDVTHAVHTFKTTCNVRARNNFQFTFQLVAAGLLNTEGFQNLKYCDRSKGFLEHLEILLYPTALEISTFGVKL